MPTGETLLLVAYVRTKTRGRTTFYYLVRGVRSGGKVTQKVIAYLGKHKTVEAAYLHWVREGRKRGRKAYATKMMKQLEPYL